MIKIININIFDYEWVLKNIIKDYKILLIYDGNHIFNREIINEEVPKNCIICYIVI